MLSPQPCRIELIEASYSGEGNYTKPLTTGGSFTGGHSLEIQRYNKYT